METKNIPSKICKSLTRLIENLPELESLSVNEVEDGECNSDTNDILFVFGADVILDSRDLPTDYCRKHEDCDEKKPMCEENMCKACPIETPAWNGSSCTTCLNTDPTKPAWNGERCVSCPTETTWNAENEKCESGKWECRTNEECKKGEYCYIYQGYNCIQEFSSDLNSSYYSGTCRNALNDLTNPKIDTHYITSNNEMTYQSAQRLCQVLRKNMISVEDLKCAHRICASGCDAKRGYCHRDTSTDVSIASSSNISSVVSEIKKAYASWSRYSWTNTKYDSCHTYILVTDAAMGIRGNGEVYNDDRGNHRPRFAMCQ